MKLIALERDTDSKAVLRRRERDIGTVEHFHVRRAAITTEATAFTSAGPVIATACFADLHLIHLPEVEDVNQSTTSAQ